MFSFARHCLGVVRYGSDSRGVVWESLGIVQSHIALFGSRFRHRSVSRGIVLKSFGILQFRTAMSGIVQFRDALFGSRYVF